MATKRAGQRATVPASRSPRVYQRAIARLTRVAVDEGHGADKTRRTLHFLLHTHPGLGSPADYVSAQNTPDFAGDVAWFEVEKIERGGAYRWPWWRAVRQVEPPVDA